MHLENRFRNIKARSCNLHLNPLALGLNGSTTFNLAQLMP